MKKPEPKSNKNAGTRSQVKKDTPKSAESIAEITILTETLRKSELKYRSLYESTREGIGMTDMEGHILECNRAFRDMLGYTEKEIKDLIYQQITPAKWHAMERNVVINKVLKTGYSDIYEKEYIKKDGTVFPVSMRVWAIKDEPGNVVGMWAIVTDITARKLAREALQESQHRLEVILDSIADGFYALDREWRFTHVNEAALRHMGKTSKEILGRTLFDLYPEARNSVTEIEYRSAMESGESRHFETQSLITDRILEIHAYPGRDVLTILFRDVTKQKRMTTALRESEATLRGILDASKESIWLFSPDGVMLMGNETALTRFGKSADDVIGKHFNEILTPELAKSRLAHLREAVESGQPVEFEDERDGIAFLHSFYPVTDAGGRVSSIACFSRDITERKKIEEILRKHLSDLEAANKELESFSYSVPSNF